MPRVRAPILSAHPFVVGALILVESDVLGIFDRYRQNTFDASEAGGILLGYRRDAHLHVLEATRPAEDDRRSRYRFYRASEPHQSIATRRWRASNGRIQYLGEWHCHPEQHASPSSLDLSSWGSIYRGASTPMLFVITGITSDWYGVGYRRELRRTYPT